MQALTQALALPPPPLTACLRACSWSELEEGAWDCPRLQRLNLFGARHLRLPALQVCGEAVVVVGGVWGSGGQGTGRRGTGRARHRGVWVCGPSGAGRAEG